MSFWDVVWVICISFLFVAYLVVLLTIFTDLFRDRDTSGGAKAVWVVALIFLPLVASLIYIVAKGRGMSERSAGGGEQLVSQQDAYIRQAAEKGAVGDAVQPRPRAW